MQDALQVTKDLADNCRSKGTAFRLGVCFSSSFILFSNEKSNVLAYLSFMFTKSGPVVSNVFGLSVLTVLIHH